MEENEQNEHRTVHKSRKKVWLTRWQAATFVLLIAIAILIPISVFTKGFTGFVVVELTKEQASRKVIDHLERLLAAEGFEGDVIVLNITEMSGVYNIKMLIGQMPYDGYMTKDGQLLFFGAINLSQEISVSREIEQEESQRTQTNMTIPPEELKKFIDCLKKANFTIYGANWCGWTVRLVQMLGGWEIVKPIYIECTEQQRLCEERGIRGYPTIFIGEKQYQGPRTFKDFAAATGCEPPVGSEQVVTNSTAGGC